MGQKVLLKEAAELTGLSEWELSSGARSGRYPVLRVGSGRGKFVYDIDLLEKRINELMLQNVKYDTPDSTEQHGKIRAIW